MDAAQREIDLAYEELGLEDRSLEELLTMREDWALDTYQLEAVNAAITEAEEGR